MRIFVGLQPALLAETVEERGLRNLLSIRHIWFDDKTGISFGTFCPTFRPEITSLKNDRLIIIIATKTNLQIDIMDKRGSLSGALFIAKP